jgi:hypothetical protein
VQVTRPLVTDDTGRVPFTASHPAAVLPLVRRGHWVTAGLVTGSVAPDLPSFVPLGLTHDQTHPPTAILWPDGLLAVGLLLAWWVLLRPGLAPLWPQAAGRSGPAGWRDPALRRDPAAVVRWTGWLALSELVGLATHLGWDAFTHADGYVVRRWAPLQGDVAGHLLVNWLQAASSVLGLAVVAAYLAVQWRRHPPPAVVEHVGPRLRTVIVAAALAVAATSAGLEYRHVSASDTTHLLLWSDTVKAGCGALIVALGLWSIGWAVLRAHQHAARDPHTRVPSSVP